ncbi:MAG: hypothetical protein AB7F86_01210 [Bdellovibrionales bacterium]
MKKKSNAPIKNFRAFVQRFGHNVRESGRRLSLILLLIGALPSWADNDSLIDMAFDENLFISVHGRIELDRATARIEGICKMLVSPSTVDQSACQWPAKARQVQAAYEQLNSKVSESSMARTGRLAARNLSRAELLLNGWGSRTSDLTDTLQAVAFARSLTDSTQSLMSALGSPDWILANALNNESADLLKIHQIAPQFTAWVQSEEPLGFFLRWSNFLPSQAQWVEGIFTCLRAEDDIAHALNHPETVRVQRRLMLKEIEVTRSGWGLPAPGLLVDFGSSGTSTAEVLAPILDQLLTLDLSPMARELNECRSLAQALASVGINEEVINSTRLQCEKARQTQNSLHLEDLPPGTATRQYALVLHETRTERGYQPSVFERRAVSLFRSLESAPKSATPCDPKIQAKLSPLIQQLRRLINNQELGG